MLNNGWRTFNLLVISIFAIPNCLDYSIFVSIAVTIHCWLIRDKESPSSAEYDVISKLLHFIDNDAIKKMATFPHDIYKCTSLVEKFSVLIQISQKCAECPIHTMTSLVKVMILPQSGDRWLPELLVCKFMTSFGVTWSNELIMGIVRTNSNLPIQDIKRYIYRQKGSSERDSFKVILT